jgi:hypothetical protein
VPLHQIRTAKLLIKKGKNKPSTPLSPLRKSVGKSSENVGKILDIFGAFSAHSWEKYKKINAVFCILYPNNYIILSRSIVNSEKYRIFAAER